MVIVVLSCTTISRKGGERPKCHYPTLSWKIIFEFVALCAIYSCEVHFLPCTKWTYNLFTRDSKSKTVFYVRNWSSGKTLQSVPNLSLFCANRRISMITSKREFSSCNSNRCRFAFHLALFCSLRELQTVKWFRRRKSFPFIR